MNRKHFFSPFCMLLALILCLTVIPITPIKVNASNGVDDFIKRCYDKALRRKPDTVGMKYWQDLINNRKRTGSSVAHEFIFSNEYTGQKRTNKQFINDLYYMFFDRKSDTEGYQYWSNNIKNGMSREEVFAGFVNSDEFYNICLGYGITAGYYTTAYPETQVNNVNLFVERLYLTCLGRIGDKAGQEYWVKGLLQQELTGTSCALNFVRSKEFVSLNLSDSDYVERLYNAFLGRKSDKNGKQYWLDLLKNGSYTRENVLKGFASSQEFKDICKSYGIKCGKYTKPDPSNDPDPDPTPTPDPDPDPTPDPDLIGYTPRFEGDMGGYMNSKYPNKMPQAVIVVPKNASSTETATAQVIQYYVSLEDGYTPEIINDGVAQNSKGFEISVGNTNRPHGKAKYSNSGSYSIKSYTNGISITGKGNTGLINGGFRFLEACGGYFFVSTNEGLATNQKQFQIDKINGISIDYERAFYYTDTDICYPYTGSTEGRLYSMVFGLNGFYQDSFCVSKGEPGRNSWYLTTKDQRINDGFYEKTGIPMGYAHTLLLEFIDPSETESYFNKHPEWFCAYDYSATELRKPDDQRKRNTSQLCLYEAVNDPELYGIILQHCYDMINASYDPNAEMQIISVSNADNDKLCTCKNCMKFRSSHGDTGGLNASYDLLELLNKLSKDIHADGKYQNVYIDSLAYTWTIHAPKGMTADDHVILRWAPIEGCYGHYLDDTSCVRCNQYYPELKEWCKVCKHVWIWDYNTNFKTTISPYSNIDVMQHNIKLYKELGVEGIYLQSNANQNDGDSEFGYIRNYIEGRMLQDPSRDYETELAFYTDACYGASGIYVREYMKHMEKQARNHTTDPNHADRTTKYDSASYETYAGIRDYAPSDKTCRMPDSEIAICEGLWQQIHTVSANESAQVKARLNRLELGWRITKSTLNVYEFSNPSTYKTQNQTLINDIKKAGFNQFNIFNDYKMSSCTHPENHPDNWCTENDYLIGRFTSSNPGTNLNPAIPNNLFTYYTKPNR